MPRSCPWCREPLSFSQRRSEACPYCERPLTEGELGELRPVDLRYEEVEAAQQRRYRVLLTWGSVVAAGISAVMPFLQIGTAIAVPLLLVAHLITVRLVLVRRSCQLLGATRRFFTRWIARFSFLWGGFLGYGLTAVPVFGVVAGVVTFAGLTTLVHRYSLWSLVREKGRLPLMLWEKVVLLGLALLTVTALVLLIGLALLLGWSVAKLAEMIGTTWG